MRKLATLCSLLLISALALGAQDTPKASDPGKTPESPRPTEPGHYYHLQFVIQELNTEGKPINNRTYSTIVATDKTDRNQSRSTVRTGSRVPIIMGGLQGPHAENKLEMQYQYIDVGVNIEAQNAHEVGGQLALYLKTEISSLAASTPAAQELANDPVIRQNMWDASVVIPVGKPTVVFSSDALENKGGMQVELTATLLH